MELNHPLKLTAVTGSNVFCCATHYALMMAKASPGFDVLGVLNFFFFCVCTCMAVKMHFSLILNMIIAMSKRVNFSTRKLLPSVERCEREKQCYWH